MNQTKLNNKKRLSYLLLFSGIFVSTWLGQNVILGVTTADWATTDGFVYLSEVSDTTHSTEHSPQKFRHAHFEYRYRVGDTSYAGRRRYRTDIPPLSQQNAESSIDKYPLDAPVTVYYDEADPSESVLETGNPPAMWLLLSLSLMFAALGFRGARDEN